MTPTKVRGCLTAALAAACLFAQAQTWPVTNDSLKSDGAIARSANAQILWEKGRPVDPRTRAALKQAERSRRDLLPFHDEGEAMRRDRAMMRSLLRDLVSDGLIRNENDALSVELTSRSLIVNGQLQLTEVWNRFRNKYIRNPEFGIFFGETTGVGKGLFLKKDDLRSEN